MKIVLCFFFYLYSIIIPSISTSNLYVIVNLDSKTSGDNYTQLSSELQTAVKQHIAQFIVTTERLKGNTLSIRANSSKTVLEMDETQHIVINTNKFFYADSKTEIFNYKINAYIDNGILPTNYYTGYTSITNQPNVISCDYNNTTPIFGYAPINNKVLNYVVNTLTCNIGLDQNGFIVIFNVESNFELTMKTPSNYGLESSYDSQYYSKLFYPKTILNFNSTTLLLFAVRNETIDIFTTNDTPTTFSISKRSHINVTDPNLTINQISYNNEYIFIATEEKGLLVLDINNVESQKCNSDNFMSNITDLIVNNRTVYVISASDTNNWKKGLYIFNPSQCSFQNEKEPFISHPHLVKFDFLLNNYTNISSTYYVGIVVNNQPPLYPEVLIELIANSDLEYSPKINKIFLTNTNIFITDIVSDIYSDYSYIYDRQSKNLYTLSRAVPNFHDSFSYIRSFSQIATGIESSMENHLFLVSLAPYINVLLIQEKEHMYVGMNLIRFSQTLECVFHKGGNYIELIMEDYGDYSMGYLNGKVVEREFYITVTEEEKRKRTGLWIAVVIGVIVVVLIIGGVLFFTFRKKGSSGEEVEVKQKDSEKEDNTRDEEYQGGNKEGVEIEEANFENKI